MNSANSEDQRPSRLQDVAEQISNASSPQITWYFDVISPFAYLQSEKLTELFGDRPVQLKPLLFAGLLNHFGNIGPAEIEVKRKATFERVVWLAHEQKIPLILPPMHPFNPLPLLRFIVAAGNTRAAMHAAFRFVWQRGELPENELALSALLAQFSLTANDLLDATVKARLLENGQSAIDAGVFGVPTTVISTGQVKQSFWGQDTNKAISAFLDGDVFYSSPNWAKAKNLQNGIQRNRG